jgi:DNA-binding NarL/FixJ family response regulator
MVMRDLIDSRPGAEPEPRGSAPAQPRGPMTKPPARAPIRVALVNDFELVLRGLEAVLGRFADQLEVVELDVRSNPDHQVDVALFDTYGQPRGGVDRVRSLATDRRVGAVAVYVWQLPVEQVDAVLAAGARGVLAKSTAGDALADALIAVSRGETVISPAFRRLAVPVWPGHNFGLTVRESEVAAFLSQGMSNHEIAEALCISEHTVKSHLKSIFQKTGVTSRGHAVARIAADVGFRRIESVG